MSIDPRFRDLEQALARLESRVAELELQLRSSCERCRPPIARCAACHRDLCPRCLACPTCPHASDGAHRVAP